MTRPVKGWWLLLPAVLTAIGCSESGPAGGAEHAVDSAGLSAPHTASVQERAEKIYARGQIDSALVLFRIAHRQALEAGDSVGIARSLTWLAQAHWRLGDYAATRELGEEALALKQRLGLEEGLFRSYNVLGLLAWNESRLLDASELFSRATDAARATGDSVNLAKVFNNLALVRTSLGAFDEARQGFMRAREMARATEVPFIEGRVLVNLGMLAIEVGDPRSAIRWIEEARTLLRAARDPVGEQSALGHLGVAYAAIGESGRAVAYLDSALHQDRAQGLKQEEASNLEQLAELHREAGNHARALRLLEEARRINTELGLSDELASDLTQQARIRETLGNLNLALRNAEEALRIHREIGSPLREVEDLVVLAELSREAGRSGDARAYTAAAQALAVDLGVRTARLAVALGRARMASSAGDALEVLRILDGAKLDLRRGGYGVEWESHTLRARAYAAAGDLESATAEGRKAVEAVERIRGTYASATMRHSYLRERSDTYADLVRVLLELGRVAEAFETADAARGKVLLGSLASGVPRTAPASAIPAADAVQGLAEGDHLLRRVAELSRTLDDLEEASLEERNQAFEAQAEQLIEELGRLRSEYAGALVRAEEGDPEGTALLGGGRPDAQRIRQSLRPGEALVEYLVTADGVELFIVRREGIRHFETVISRSGLASRVRIARAALQARDTGWKSGFVALEGLREILLGPAERGGALAGVQRLIIVPHGELSYLPFAALRDGGTGHFLAEDYLITDLPTAGALPALRGRAPAAAVAAAGRLVAFAPFPRRLPGTVLEMDAIRKAFDHSTYFTGRDASEERFRENLGRAGMIHVATHGVMNARNPLFSRIELAPGAERSPGIITHPETYDDGWLEVHELLRATVRASLVFLSGCETGIGPGWSTAFGRGEESATLGQAFLHAGADNVVATLWRIDDPGAAAFATLFYSELSRSHTPVTALAQAQRSLIHDSRYGSPYYWAGYRLTGTGDGPAESR